MKNFNGAGKGMLFPERYVQALYQIIFSLKPREAHTFFLDKESMQRNQGVECSPKFRTSRLNLKTGTKWSSAQLNSPDKSGSDSLRFYTSPDSKFLTAVHPKAVPVKRFKPTALLMIFCVLFSSLVFTQAVAQGSRGQLGTKGLNQMVLGGVVSSVEDGKPIEGASVSVDKKHTRTDKEGRFTISVDKPTGLLTIKHIGYKEQRVAYENTSTTLNIALQANEKQIEEVEVVSTGYQKIPKERATGSFTHINSEMVNRSTGLNILDRLTAVTSGLNSTPGFEGKDDIKVHGISTIFASTAPLIVLNGFPYEGRIEQINPADVEDIYILKDAAASSIWGSRSGNGVIVITTKSGKHNQKATVELTSSLSVRSKPDLFYIPQLSASEFISLEEFLFSRGFYNAQINIPYRGISDAVQIFNDTRLKKITPADSADQINRLIHNDVRDDLNRYVHRNPFHQQYALNVRGGGASHRYYVSGGFDRSSGPKRVDSYRRFSFNANNTFSVLDDRLEFIADVAYSGGDNSVNSHPYTPRTPYELLADENNMSLAVTGRNTFRKSYADTVGLGKLLDWQYRPLDELSVANSSSKLGQYRLRAGVNLKIVDGLSLSADYQYSQENTDLRSLATKDSYTARNLINQYTQVTTTGIVRIIPVADILNTSDTRMNTAIFRPQINFNKQIGDTHMISAILGYEGSDSRTTNNSQVFYGYDADTRTNVNNTIDPQRNYPYYHDRLFGTISTAPTEREYIHINQSFYTNVGYTFKGIYTVSGSARRDESNIFGVKTNQKGVPLWSAGLAWDIYKEGLFKYKTLSSLKIRGTYGYNGNVDRSVSALMTASYSDGLNLFGNPTGIVFNPPNPSLRWEKVKTGNIGVDFGVWNQAITGSIDVYRKKSVDLISNNPIAQQSGISEFKGNGANLLTQGLDLVLNSYCPIGNIGLKTTLLFNYNTNKVTRYLVKQSSNFSVINNGANPLEGYPLEAVFSFPSVTLDGQGAAQGILDGMPTKDYTAIVMQFAPEQLTYHGTRSPKYFGSLITAVNYKNVELSCNISYKLGHYFRRSDVFSGSNYGTAANTVYTLSGFEERWQKPGDEARTRIPALVYPQNALQDLFFGYSDYLVEKASHIRLQDVRCSYTLPISKTSRVGLHHLQVFAYARNLGIVWKASNQHIDPDYGSSIIPQPLVVSFGINAKI
ncbi:SusC/RagA family TonB-linked outer membrane protein [Sphingobacterium tabacisoli]|uniref:SusC/RagA family TonB-linked outer membrane protein n=1 Tax=Sphingobacterium tabacisoli TaxID=2044855 RepID=A0ABW5L5K0_9SPHI|nr:SusC/RagA family TonB-linked outer membrane protein [Sphingobacterium tabacisoli]